MYFLEGYDNEWSTPSEVRYVSYTELPGGTYTFKVKATNSDGIWKETPYQIKKTGPPLLQYLPILSTKENVLPSLTDLLFHPP